MHFSVYEQDYVVIIIFGGLQLPTRICLVWGLGFIVFVCVAD